MNRRHQGFTLVELLGTIVLMGIIASLTSLLVVSFTRTLNQIYNKNSLNAKGLLVTSSMFHTLNDLGPEIVELSCGLNQCVITFGSGLDIVELYYEEHDGVFQFWYTKNDVLYSFDIGEFQFTNIVFNPIVTYDYFSHVTIEIEISSASDRYTFVFSYLVIDYQSINA